MQRARTNALKTAMFNLIESNNPYAFNALLRCFFEHYLKFMYVWVRFLVEKADAPGREYFAYCAARESSSTTPPSWTLRSSSAIESSQG